jgi:60 kDa SS-A/Ro ribonucleoprotein
MSKTNVVEKKPAIATHEGAKASHPPHAAAALRRAIMACLLWEDQFYESGEEISDRIKKLVPQVPADVVAEFAVRARTDMKLRHAPLLLVACMAAPNLRTHNLLVAATLEKVVQRADELAEFVAIYAKVWGYPSNAVKKHLSAQVKKGLAKAFAKFREYSLAKYDRDGGVKMRDVLFLSHAKPVDAPLRRYTRLEREAERKGELVRRQPMSPTEALYKRIAEQTLETPDTWEVELSAGKDKKETFERLITEQKLGALALLRNLRNMTQAKVDPKLIEMALATADITRVLPHRFIAAARVVPALEHKLEPMMLAAAANLPKLSGKTILLIDVSGSMDAPLSQKSDLKRIDAAVGLAIIARELCEELAILTFSERVVQVPPRVGFALGDAILKSQPHSGTYLGKAVEAINQHEYDRVIVVTDEQSADSVGAPKGKGYMINVASYKHGVGYGKWNKIDGFSEAVIRYIVEAEKSE